MIAATKAQVKTGKLLVGGEWVEGKSTFATINPATGEELTQIAEAGPEGVDAAVQAARKAFEQRGKGAWSSLSASARGQLLWKLAELLEKNIDELAELETLDNGK